MRILCLVLASCSHHHVLMTLTTTIFIYDTLHPCSLYRSLSAHLIVYKFLMNPRLGKLKLVKALMFYSRMLKCYCLVMYWSTNNIEVMNVAVEVNGEHFHVKN